MSYSFSSFFKSGMVRSLRHRDYTMYALAGFVSNLGLWVQRVAVGWLTWTYTESWTWLGLIVFSEGMMATIVMPIAGTYADRIDRIFLAKLSQVGLMLISALLAFLTFLDITNIWILLVLMMMSGVVEGLWAPVRLSMAPNLVPKEDLSSAVGVSASLFNLAQFLGPAVAGIIIASFESFKYQFGFAFGFNSITFLSYFIVLFFIKLRTTNSRSGKKLGFVSDFKAGVRYILDTPGLLLFVFLMLSTSFCLRPFREIFPGIADGVFSRGADGLALLTSATGLGAIIGCLFVANMKSTKGVVRLMYTFLIIDVILQIFLVFCWNFTLALTCVALMGFAVTTAGISGQVLLQSCVHDEMRGRVISLWGIIMRGGVPTGAFFLGSLVSLLGYEAGLLIISAIFICVLLIAIPRSGPVIERMEAPPPPELI